MSKKHIILIGGVPGTGKTTLSMSLSKQMDIPWISTDQIRTILDVQAPPMQVENVVSEQQKSEEIWTGVKRLIQRPHPWKGLIIEGVAIMPHLVHTLEENTSAVFLLEENKDTILETLHERAKLPWINTKSEEQINAKADYLLELNEFYKSEASKYGYSTITATKSDADLKNVLSLVT